MLEEAPSELQLLTPLVLILFTDTHSMNYKNQDHIVEVLTSVLPELEQNQNCREAKSTAGSTHPHPHLPHKKNSNKPRNHTRPNPNQEIQGKPQWILPVQVRKGKQMERSANTGDWVWPTTRRQIKGRLWTRKRGDPRSSTEVLKFVYHAGIGTRW